MSVAEREFDPGKERENDMKNLTYEIYLANPAVREQLEREARRARAEAMHQYIVTPLMKMFSQMFRRRTRGAQAGGLAADVRLKTA